MKKELESKIRENPLSTVNKGKQSVTNISNSQTINRVQQSTFTSVQPFSASTFRKQINPVVGSQINTRLFSENTNRQTFIRKVKASVSRWQRLGGQLPYYFFYYYYPKRYNDVTPTSVRVRYLIYDFKNGEYFEDVFDILEKKLRSTFDADCLRNMCFVCVPASTKQANKNRYEAFSDSFCTRLHMANGYGYITIVKEKIPKHLGGDNVAEYKLDCNYFNGKLIVLFDDVVTLGNSMLKFKTLLEKCGAEVICALSIGRTCISSSSRLPHPWTGSY